MLERKLPCFPDPIAPGDPNCYQIEMTFPFERLAVYQRAEQFAELAESFVVRAKSHITHGMSDQLSRAANSIPQNVAEGLGKWGLNDRKRYFQIARGSVFECVPIIRYFRRKRIISDSEYETAYSLLDELGKMLTTMIKGNHRDTRSSSTL